MHFKQNLLESLRYVVTNKKYFFIAMLVFVVGLVMGFMLPSEMQQQILDSAIEFISGITEDKTMGELVSIIFFNNLKVNFYMVLFGVFIGIVPLLILLSNGALIGIIFDVFGKTFRDNCLWVIALVTLLPHGIIEIPTFFISAGIGFKIGFQWLFPEYGGRLKSVYHAFQKGLWVFVFLVIPLVLLAAAVETFITPFLGVITAYACGYDLTQISLLNMTG